MVIKDPEIFQIIDEIGHHFRNYVNIRPLKKAIGSLEISLEKWNHIEKLISQSETDRLQGYMFRDLYERILAASALVYYARKTIIHNLKLFMPSGTGRDDTIVKMAVKTFPSNLTIFADMLSKLYMKTISLEETEHKREKPFFERMPELEQIGHYLADR